MFNRFNTEKFKEELKDQMLIVTIIILLPLLIYLIFNVFISVNTVNSGSMYPTMQTGDISISIKSSNIKRFDVVQVKNDKSNDVLRYEKRVIGLPGETIEIKDGVVYIDGNRLQDNYAFLSNSEAPYGRNMDKLTIPQGEYFIMGDNRDFSNDSRELGTYNEENIMYKQIAVLKLSKYKKDNELF